MLNFLSPNAQKELIYQTFLLPNFPLYGTLAIVIIIIQYRFNALSHSRVTRSGV